MGVMTLMGMSVSEGSVEIRLQNRVRQAPARAVAGSKARWSEEVSRRRAK